MNEFREQNKSKKNNKKNKYTNPSREDIINQADKFYSQGNTSEAEKYYQLEETIKLKIHKNLK